MHNTQKILMNALMKKYFKNNTNKTVYDIGSYDVNGNHKNDVTNLKFNYIGVDVLQGPNVDLVVDSNFNYSKLYNQCDYIISGSCLEHVEAPWLFALEIYKSLKPNGICIIILPFKIKEHRYPLDCYRILPDGLKYLFTKHVPLNLLQCGWGDTKFDTFIVCQK